MLFFDRTNSEMSIAFRDRVEDMFTHEDNKVREYETDKGAVVLHSDHSVAVWDKDERGVDTLTHVFVYTNETDALYTYGQSVARLDFYTSTHG